MPVKHAKKHLHLANLVKKAYMDTLNFCELPNRSTNLQKETFKWAHRECLCHKLVCMPRPLARDDLWGTTFNAANWWKVISYIHQHFGHRVKNNIKNPEN